MDSVIKKVSLFQSLAIAIILIAAIFGISIVVKNSIIADVEETFKDRIVDVRATFEVLNESVRGSAITVSNVFKDNFKNIDIDYEDKVEVNGIQTSVLSSNEEVLNNNNELIDDFTKVTGAVATIFVKQDDDFYRIATSVHKTDGSRAIGTFLTKNSPAFDPIINKKEYIGTVKLFGKNYMAVYSPIVSNNDVIGVLFVAYNFDELYNVLQSKLEEVKFGQTGYLFVIDVKDNVLAIHPRFKGKKIDELDNDLKTTYSDIIKQKEGSITYKYKENGLDRTRLATFTSFNEWGITLVGGANFSELLTLNDKLRTYLIFGGIALLAIILFISYLIIRKTVNEPLVIINKDLSEFFAYLNREKDSVEFIDVNTKDEFGQMAKMLSQNIDKTRLNLEEDAKLIKETISVLGEFEQGDLQQRLSIEVSNPALTQLKNVLNNMGENLEANINNVLNVLGQYSSHNYLNRVDKKGLKEHLSRLADGVNYLGDSVTQMLIENKTNGLSLEEGSHLLLANVDKLNLSSNEAAASLEETAAAIEEITSTIRSNTENISKMSQLSSGVTSSAKEGEKLANQTTNAMEEINTQVTLINEAIGVIDNIAFQTNILSLNAAVEAATAGEAGKGFAVVAQEVRNLAARSAEAAHEIKEIVETATLKADEGKKIATSMIEGYKQLNQNISQTIGLITDIQNASKEQLLGIEQINGVVNQLDQQTQQNASIASQTHDIALSTDKISAVIVENVSSKKFKDKDRTDEETFNDDDLDSEN